MPKKVLNSPLEAKTALSTYLDDMLQQATEVTPVADLEEVHDHLFAESLLVEPEPAKKDRVLVAVKNQPVQHSAAVAEVENDPTDLESTVTEEALELPASIFPLQFLMFKVGDNLLALPLIKMSTVINWGQTLTRLPSEPDWVHGILQHRDNNIRVVDSAGILKLKHQGAPEPGFVLVLEGDRWGITCDVVENVITLEYDDIQWHESIGNKMTLGTIRDSLASLLSPLGIVNSLQPDN